MRKPNFDPTHLKNRIILSIYIFRSLPNLYFETITSYDPKVKEKTRLVILNLIQDKVIKKSFANNGSVYLRLTRKGYKQVSIYLLPQEGKPIYTYRRDRGINHTISDHHYYNFAFVWNFISKHPQLLNKNIQIYDDSNINQCKVLFSYESKKFIYSPDLLIYYPDETNKSHKKAILIESDAGGETYRKIYEKFVEYSLFLQSGLQQNSITGSSIYFIFHSKIRAKADRSNRKKMIKIFRIIFDKLRCGKHTTSTMSNTLTSIDITYNPELKRIAEEVNKSGVSLVLREDNRDIALLTPVGKTAKTLKNKKGFLALAGKLKGILDADWIIHILTGHGATINVLKNLTADDIAVSLVTVGEIYEGAFTSTNPQVHLDIFREFFAPFHLLGLNEPIMERFAEIRSLLRRRGELISDFDLLIGTTALYYDLTVLTYNKRHFKRVPDLKIYPHI